MTVVPMGGSTALLVCDGCGTEDTGSASPYDSDFVWPLIAALGWTGPAFSTGAHRCPRRSEHTPPTGPPAPTRTRPHSASYDVRLDGPALVITPLTGSLTAAPH
ncbi:hypothetical protein ACQPZJ_37875 [Actinoplanes sp. CA-054009]